MWHVYEARDGDWIPFERLIRVDHNSPEYQSHKLANSFYAQVLADRALRHGREPRIRQADVPVPEPAQQCCGRSKKRPRPRSADLGVMDKQLRDYSRRSTSMSSGSMRLGEVPAVDAAPGKPVAELDALAIMRHHARPRGSRPIASGRWWSRWHAASPTSARAAILAARLARLAGRRGGFRPCRRQRRDCACAGDSRRAASSRACCCATALDFGPWSKLSTEDTERYLKRAMRCSAKASRTTTPTSEALWGLRNRRHSPRQGPRPRRAGIARRVSARARERRDRARHSPTSRDGSRSRKR